jgi:hypothetical protein
MTPILHIPKIIFGVNCTLSVFCSQRTFMSYKIIQEYERFQSSLTVTLKAWTLILHKCNHLSSLHSHSHSMVLHSHIKCWKTVFTLKGTDYWAQVWSEVWVKGSGVAEFIYWSSVECRGLNVEGEGKKSRARVKSRGWKVEGKKSRVKSRGWKFKG